MGRGRYIRISEKLGDPSHDLHPHARSEPACRMAAWIDMLINAEWREGQTRPVGTLVWSVRFMATRWCRSIGWVSGFLGELEERGRIERTQSGQKRERNRERNRERKRGRNPSAITICNYTTYQTPLRPSVNDNVNDNVNATKNICVNKEYRPKPRNYPTPPIIPPSPSADAEDEKNSNWLSPYLEAWEARFGGHANAGALAKRIRPLHEKHGADEVIQAWKLCLEKADERYSRSGPVATRFAETYGSWAERTNTREQHKAEAREIQRHRQRTRHEGPATTGELRKINADEIRRLAEGRRHATTEGEHE